MPSSFDIAVKYLLNNEGSDFVDDPDDSGGATKFGLTLAFMQGVQPGFTLDQLKNLTVELAKLYYKNYFWDKGQYQNIASQPLCNYFFDCAVNHGEREAVRLLQHAIWATTQQDHIHDDGIFGILTLSSVNFYQYSLLNAMRSERAGFYRQIVALKPDKAKFLNGWLRRAYEFIN